ncbi:MAG TPA: lactate utilization protein [Chitinophagaceae bacterium]
MNISPSKENILKKIRKALSQSTPVPFPNSEGTSNVFQPLQQEPEVEFAEQFTKLQGKFIFCEDHNELAIQLNALVARQQLTSIYCRDEALKQLLTDHAFVQFADVELEACDASITNCEALVARTGSMVLSAAQPVGRTVSVYAPIHICIAYTSQLVYDIKDAVQLIKNKYGSSLPSMITFATGPSRTADIEKTLVVGVHGPKEVYCFLIDD